MQQRAFIPLLFVMLCFAAVALPAQTEVERHQDAAADGVVDISNVSGSVLVSGWDRNEVEVTGTLERDVEKLDIDRRGDRVIIKVVLPRRSSRDSSAELTVRVPRRSTVNVETVSADITLKDVDGNADLESVSGRIEVVGARLNRLGVETVSGGIEIEAEVAAVEAESVSGSVRLRQVQGEISVETVSGRVEIDGGEVSSLEAESVSGRVEIACSLGSRARLRASSHSGSVTLSLPASTSAEFDIETYSGSIRNELGPEARRVGRYAPGKELRFTTGSGDARVSVTSFSGSVNLRKR